MIQVSSTGLKLAKKKVTEADKWKRFRRNIEWIIHRIPSTLGEAKHWTEIPFLSLSAREYSLTQGLEIGIKKRGKTFWFLQTGLLHIRNSWKRHFIKKAYATAEEAFSRYRAAISRRLFIKWILEEAMQFPFLVTDHHCLVFKLFAKWQIVGK